MIEGKGEGEEEERGQRKKKEVKRRGMWLVVTQKELTLLIATAG